MKNSRLTRLSKRGLPELKNPLHMERAIGSLYEYEETGYTPAQIRDMEETIFNLQERVKRLESWD